MKKIMLPIITGLIITALTFCLTCSSDAFAVDKKPKTKTSQKISAQKEQPSPPVEKTDYEKLIAKGDYQAAIDIMKPLAESGDIKASQTLGFLYVAGKGVDEDIEESLKWFLVAADKGDAISQYMVGGIYIGDDKLKNPSESFKYFSKAAEQELPNAMLYVGLAYLNGDGVEKDYTKALRWLSKAAKLGVANANYNIGVMYVYGNGVDQDYNMALKYFVKGAEGGDADSFTNIGAMYANGKGLPRNLVEAYKYTIIATMLGTKLAESNLASQSKYMSQSQIELAQKKAQALIDYMKKQSSQGKPVIISLNTKNNSVENSSTRPSISCNDPIIKGMVIDRAIRSWGSEMSQMGMSRNMLSVQNIRTRNKTKRACECVADVIIDFVDIKKQKPVSYTVEITDDGSPYVTVYGF